jgi:hypothetical protein
MPDAEYQPGQIFTAGKLLRRIWPHPSYYRDGKVTSQVFDRRHGDHLSMALAELISPTALAAQAPTPGFGVLEIDVAAVCAEGLQVVFDPSETEGPAHVQVRGSLTGAVRKRLAMKARVVIPPNVPGV